MHLLFAANFPPDTGFAWDTIERVLRSVGEKLVADGHRVSVSYPALAGRPSVVMEGAPFGFAALDFDDLQTSAGARNLAAQLRARGIDAVYLTDRPTWSFHYRHLRAAGVQKIFVHDRTSGVRLRSHPMLHLAKRVAHHVRAISGDCFIGVSRFVRDRLVQVNGTPASRTHAVYNGIDLRRLAAAPRADLHRLLGISADTPIVFCAGRAQPYKGIQTVIDAAARLRAQRVAFVFCGEGSYRAQLEARAAELGLSNFFFLGRRDDVPSLLKAASIAVIPSLWAEAFGLTVVEAMAAGVPLVASRVGGIPELVQDGVTGLLIEPGDADALAHAIASLLASPAQCAALSEAACNMARLRFSLTRVANDLYELIAPQLQPASRMVRPAQSTTLVTNA